MSDANPLAEAERLLRELEVEVLSRIKANEAATESPQMNAAVGRLTYIDAYQQEQVSLHARRQLKTQLASVQLALERVKAGTYGICIQCDKPIPPERLEYLPDTPFCTSCNASRGS
ncbi:MAG: TraR/DksA C4-type zinc finger protein [Pirellulaceae bacterium]